MISSSWSDGVQPRGLTVGSNSTGACTMTGLGLGSRWNNGDGVEGSSCFDVSPVSTVTEETEGIDSSTLLVWTFSSSWLRRFSVTTAESSVASRLLFSSVTKAAIELKSNVMMGSDSSAIGKLSSAEAK